jgi:prepilin-type N-terminal cleavage/methylation domain-containing protein
MHRIVPHNSAFTLLELIFVMLLLSVTLALAAPSLKGFTDARRTRDAAATILSAIKYARAEAVTEGRAYRVEFDEAERTCRITTQQEGAAFTPVADHAARMITLPEDINLECQTPSDEDVNRKYITIRPDGFAEPMTVRVTDPHGFTLEVFSVSSSDEYAIRTAEQGVTR